MKTERDLEHEKNLEQQKKIIELYGEHVVGSVSFLVWLHQASKELHENIEFLPPSR